MFKSRICFEDIIIEQWDLLNKTIQIKKKNVFRKTIKGGTHYHFYL